MYTVTVTQKKQQSGSELPDPELSENSSAINAKNQVIITSESIRHVHTSDANTSIDTDTCKSNKKSVNVT